MYVGIEEKNGYQISNPPSNAFDDKWLLDCSVVAAGAAAVLVKKTLW